MLDLPARIAGLVPGLLGRGPLSVACVRTTHPKYLVFGPRSDRPECVVQFGPADEMMRIHQILKTLHRSLPDLVAEPLACVPWGDGLYVEVQAGLPGMPWFRLGDEVRTRRAWRLLVGRAREALSRFHEVVRATPGWWSPSVRPGEELRRQAAACAGSGVELSAAARGMIAAEAERLDELGGRPHPWQHGDFCFNNILVRRGGLAIIDFEEFGLTSMPRQDEIGLTLSARAFSPAGALPPEEANSALDPVERAGWPEAAATRYHAGFFLFHLLWRIRRSLDRPTRARVRQELLAVLENLARADGPSRRAG